MVSRANSQEGFTYLGLIYAVAISGIALAGTGILWSLESRREKEKELLFIGEQYRQALVSYAKRTVGKNDGQNPQQSPGQNQGAEGAPVFPERLEELLEDRRSFPAAHHLRRLFRDPMTGHPDWRLIRREGRIVGIASRDNGKPVKIANFQRGQEEFAGAGSYADWQFIAEVAAAPAPGTPAGPGGKP
jgi:type II secretory pathway pseudopilin PulG